MMQATLVSDCSLISIKVGWYIPVNETVIPSATSISGALRARCTPSRTKIDGGILITCRRFPPAGMSTADIAFVGLPDPIDRLVGEVVRLCARECCDFGGLNGVLEPD